MATSTVYDAIKGRIVSELGGTYAVRDWEEIEVALQQGGDPFIAIEESDDNVEAMSVGAPDANWIKDSGTIDAHIFVPSTGLLTSARTIADAVRAAMQYWHFSQSGVASLRMVNVHPPEPGVIHDGLWHSMLVSMEFEHSHAVATAQA